MVALAQRVDRTEQPPGPQQGPQSVSSEIRASDADRAGVADALRTHCAAGRLEVEELEQRLAVALSARTVGELERLVEDLPGMPAVPRSGRQAVPAPVKPGLPGVRSFYQSHELAVDRTLCFRQALDHMLPAMVAGGFDVVSRVEHELLVFQRQSERVVVSFTDSGEGGTRLVVQGRARRRVRKLFARLSN